MDKNEVLNLINEVFDCVELQLGYNEKYNVFTITDLQHANFGGIENTAYCNIIDCINRIENYIDDYFYNDCIEQLSSVYDLQFEGRGYVKLCSFIKENNKIKEMGFDYKVLNFISELYNYENILRDNKEVAKLMKIKNVNDREIEYMCFLEDIGGEECWK